MKKNNKKFTIYFLIIFAVAIVGIVAYNLIFDPFSVFADTNYDAVKNKKVMPNERYVKMKYVLENSDKYDSYLIGSCTSNFMNLDKVPTGKWYNLTYTNNTISEMNRSLKLLLKRDVKIKRVLVQISDASLKLDVNEYKEICSRLLNYCSYPEGAKETAVFYARYLTYFPLTNPAKFDPWIEGSKHNIFKGGSFVDELPKDESVMLESHEDSFRPDKFGTYEAPYNPEDMALLKEMKELCDQHNIEFELFIIPEFIENYKHLDIKAFSEAKRKIVEFTQFYDFTSVNYITQEQKYWCDPIHINDWGSKMMVDRIFYQDKTKAPKINGFGVYVTKQNVEQHIKKTEEEFYKLTKTE